MIDLLLKILIIMVSQFQNLQARCSGGRVSGGCGSRDSVRRGRGGRGGSIGRRARRSTGRSDGRSGDGQGRSGRGGRGTREVTSGSGSSSPSGNHISNQHASADEEVQLLKDNVVVASSRALYLRNNIHFMSFIPGDGSYRSELIPSLFLHSIETAERKDQDSGISKQSSNAEVHKLLTSALTKYKSFESRPIKIELITFTHFSHYLSYHKQNQTGHYLSASYYEGMRSSLSHLFRCGDREMPRGFLKDLGTMMGGLKRSAAREKQDLGLKVTEGKVPLTFLQYTTLCNVFMGMDSLESNFGHCFLTLEWNLMSCADSVAMVNIKNIEWHDDCLVMHFAHSKSDQEGVHHKDPWHIYSNPLVPDICPILSFAKYILSYPTVLKGDCRLFSGSHQYSRFNKILHRVLYDNEEIMAAIGCDIKEIGTHSIRKGAATLCASGCTVSPPVTSICLRDGWTKGGIKDKYLHFEKAGDQFVGRCVSGLDVTSPKFAVSPAFFKLTNEQDKEVIKQLIDTCCDGMSPQTANFVSFCIASIYYHFDYLQNVLPKENPLWSSCVMMDRNEEVSQMVRISYPWDMCESNVRITGIPPHVMILAQMERVLSGQESMPVQIMKIIIDKLDEREVSTGLSMNSIKDMFERSHSRLENRLGFFLDNQSNANATNGSTERGKSKKVCISMMVTTSYCPRDMRFPPMTLQALINHWFLPDFTMGVPEFFRLKAQDVKQMKRGRQKLHEMGKVMTKVEEVSRARDVWLNDNTTWKSGTVNQIYYTIMDAFKIPGQG